MNIRTTTLLALALASLPCLAADPSSTGAVATPASRIVGTWIVKGEVNGANCTPASSGPAGRPSSYLVFHSGGTLTELPRLPSSASPAGRSFGVGRWYYDKASDSYLASFRFDWYVNGVVQGYQTVDREVRISADGETMAGPAISTRYLENGQEVYSQCGDATATRF